MRLSTHPGQHPYAQRTGLVYEPVLGEVLRRIPHDPSGVVVQRHIGRDPLYHGAIEVLKRLPRFERLLEERDHWLYSPRLQDAAGVCRIVSRIVAVLSQSLSYPAFDAGHTDTREHSAGSPSDRGPRDAVAAGWPQPERRDGHTARQQDPQKLRFHRVPEEARLYKQGLRPDTHRARQPFRAYLEGGHGLSGGRSRQVRLRLHSQARFVVNLAESFFGKMPKTMLRGIRASSYEEMERKILQYFDEVNKERSSTGGPTRWTR